MTKAPWVTFVFKFNLLVLLAPNYKTNTHDNNLVSVERAYVFDETKASMVLIIHNNKQYSLLCRQQGDDKEKDKKTRARVKTTTLQKWNRYHSYSSIKSVIDCAIYLNKVQSKEQENIETILSKLPSFKSVFSKTEKDKIKITQLVDNTLLVVAYLVEVEENKNMKLMIPLKKHISLLNGHNHVQSIWSYFEQGPYSNPALVNEWMTVTKLKTKETQTTKHLITFLSSPSSSKSSAFSHSSHSSPYLVPIPLSKAAISTLTEMQINRSIFETAKPTKVKTSGMDSREENMVAMIDREKKEIQRIKAADTVNKDLVARIRMWVEDRAISRSDALTFAHLQWNLNEREASDLLFPPPRLEDEDHQFILEFTKDELLGSQIDFILAVSQNRPLVPDVQFVRV